ncbi:beta-ketoacyl synthase N-terminal-like domain-containing protein [Streptomyces sp. NBC_00503]|uniref:beta-ketoacyl synthase N-terminal-like domain-containing protein n=1 Tax=Streptomyces sp. NBC_00503 TaxID=2903659 RepID=UPI002E804497|nr:beta-ketoacyl synthase N-terminal-like domain-containing protein [Streptomyces sp. NBC_00503]WUD86342.1 3-oxoacyl-ACP synthase [Streptomyces sp. NBC_00503]
MTAQSLDTTVVVTGAAVLLPGADTVRALAEGPAVGGAPVEPAAHVGKKGLRYKDRATQLGYALTAAALRDAGLLGADEKDGLSVPATSVGVVASSNFGNLDTVTRALDTIREETVTATSPMDLPNASSNVIASSAAIRYGLRGPNLMVCNGETSGLDAVHWAATMIAAGRTERVLVLGVEPDNEVVRRLLGGGHAVDGGAALVLESGAAADDRSATVRAVLGAYRRGAGESVEGGRRWELPEHLGTASGAHGLLQVAAAVGLFDAGEPGPVQAVTGSRAGDARADLLLLAPRAA